MWKIGGIFVIVLFLWCAAVAQAKEPAKIIATGEWSQAVKDHEDYALRARILLGERPVVLGGRERHEIITYIELQDASEAVGRSMQLFCDFGKTDFRPENKSGLDFELLDKDKHPIGSGPYAFSGGVPASQCLTLPSDGTIRLRTSPFGVSDATGLAIAPSLGKLWVLQPGDGTEYALAATFTVDPSKAVAPANASPNEHVWHGTIVLPPVRISGRQLMAASTQPSPATTQASVKPDPIDALVADLARTHGLWENGVYQPIKLPADAATEKVLDQAFKRNSFQDGGRITKYQILEQRKVEISPMTGVAGAPVYEAIRIESNCGPKIVLLQYLQSNEWWNRIYDAPR